MQRQRHNITLRGRRTNNARAPQGLPLEGNYIPVHRLGSRVRTPSQSMMQQERQMMRRRPHITALRLAHSRPINMENPSNVKKFVNPYLAENIALHPMMAKTGRSKYNKLNSPLPISAMAQRLSLSPSRGIKAPPLESELWQQWQERQMQIHRERSRAY
jgi:hypothetical protein